MPLVRSVSNAFQLTDWSKELQVIPNRWDVLSEAGLFQEESVASFTVTFEQIDKSLGLINDQVRGFKPQANQDYQRKLHTYAVPHFPVFDQILPQDVQGRRAYGSDAAETSAAVMARKMERIRASFDATLEYGRWYTLSNGTVYAPNGTISGDFYTDASATRKSVGFALGVGTTDLIAKIEEVISHIQDNAQSGGVVTQIVGYCSTEFFSALVNHPKTQAAYQYYSSTQEPLRTRLGGSGIMRRFEHGGITFVEIRGQYAGNRFVAANEAIFVPLGTDGLFSTYFAPANRLGYENTLGERSYLWSYNDPQGTSIELSGEMNVLNILRRPQVVVKGTTT